MPWYRPIRVYHIVSGGEQGFRDTMSPMPERLANMLSKEDILESAGHRDHAVFSK